MAFFTGFGVSSIIYYILNRIWPSPGAFQDFKEVDESDFALQEAEADDTHSDVDSKDKIHTEDEMDAVAVVKSV